MNQNQNAPHILIVDDDVCLARSLALIFKRKGYVVSIAADGLSAIEQVKTAPADIVLMDFKMPGMNGIETYQHLKSIRPNLTALLMTGFAEDDQVQAALQAGILYVLVKPLDIDHLLTLIPKVLARRQTLALIVDDYPEACAQITRVLERKGYQVTCVESGEQAIEAVRQRHYPIIFIDLKLPTMDGLQTYLALRAIDPDITAIMITGYREEMDAQIQAALAHNAHACLYKPFDTKQVQTLVEEIEHRERQTKDEGRRTDDERGENASG
ncbi:MAG: response regulator [Anaerolineae bacterium]|nr:response regulator [Anaerolineae bacterium]